MTKYDDLEISDLSLVPVDADIGNAAASVGYDGGFSLLEPVEDELISAPILGRPTYKRSNFQIFTCD